MNQFKLFLVALFTSMSADAFVPVMPSTRPLTPMQMAVVDIGGENAFDKTIKSAGSSLVVVDYSTTWCGPCKVIAPKFDEFSDKYPNAVFLKVRNSKNAGATSCDRAERSADSLAREIPN